MAGERAAALREVGRRQAFLFPRAMKDEIKHRMTRRLTGWDYCQRAIYMITITLADRTREWLGSLILTKNGEARNLPAKNGEAQNHGAVAAHSCAAIPATSGAACIEPTSFGEAVIDALMEMPRLYPQVEIIEKQLMPEHFHFIIFVHEPLPKPLGALIRGFKAGAAKRWKISTSPEYAERLADALAAAAHGAVIISPCISDGERQIAREALKRKLPLVTLQNKGFARLQKPVGRYFDACAEGRLLMMAPAAWPYTPQEKPMTRFDATALNRLCQWLAGEDALDINYHGMKPANIDQLAKVAAQVEACENPARPPAVLV